MNRTIEDTRDRAYRMRWWTLSVLSLSLVIVIVDDTIINVALPTLQRELDASAVALQWIVTSYIVVFAGLLLTMGTLGDRFGRRRLLRLGLLTFAASSLVGAFAGSTSALIAARTAMGIGGAMIMPSTLAVLIDVFPREERVKAIGIWAAIAHLGIPLGPVLGGWLLERYWWGSVLLINVPIATAILIAGVFVVPESHHPSPPRSDVLGMVLSTASLSSLVYAVIEAPASGWSSAEVLGGVLAAIAAGIAFLAHERRVRKPMLDVSLFGDARLGWGTVAITLASFALAGLTFDLTQFFQIVNGHTPLAAGLRILPLVIGFGLAGHVGQHFVRGLGTGRTVTAGLGVLAFLFVALAGVELGTDYWLLGSALFLIGMAMGMVFVPATDAVMSAVPERDAGVGSALNDASRQVGAALGIGALGSLTNAAYRQGMEGTVAGLGSSAATVAKESVAGAMHLANEIGGQGGQALRDAAGTAFTDGFAVALLAAAGVLGTGAVLVWRRLVPADTPRRRIRHHPKRATPPEASRDPSTPCRTAPRRDVHVRTRDRPRVGHDRRSRSRQVTAPSSVRVALGRRRRSRTVRRVVLWGGALGAAIVLAAGGAVVWLYGRAASSNVGELSFANELRIPPQLEPRVDSGGRKVFDLRLEEGQTEFRAGKPTSTWGANGAYLGPTLRAGRGDDVQVNVSNELGETTTVHWHGMHLPAKADGGPHQPIHPGTTWSPQWTIDQPAATLWYHPHTHQLTANHVYRGIAGLFILDDQPSAGIGLPRTYGVDDVPVIIQDKRFNSDGSLDFDEPMFSPAGILGSDILVNGTRDPYFQTTTRTVRFRLLNASNARVYNVGFDNDRGFQLIGTDGGLLERAHTTRRVQLSPGERAEVLASFAPGERAILRSLPPELGLNWFQNRFAGGDDTFDLLQIRSAPDLGGESAPVDRLTNVGGPAEADAVRARVVELNGSSRINGRRMDMARADFEVVVDTTEVWEVRNRSGNIHNLHLHDVQFRVLEYQGRPPPPHLVGLKDTVFLPPGASARLVAEFSDYADASSPYMFHCHLLAHEDNGMMGQFVVVERGQPAALRPPLRHH